MTSPLPFVLGTHYYRPPFPRRRWWPDDIKAIADSGFNAVQLWLVWGWVEPSPGRFKFDDYDRIAELADTHGLGVVLTTLPELNPFWLPRLLPDGHMVDVEGRMVRSSPRSDCLSGLVPGLCSDHPEVRTRMINFLETCGGHFRTLSNLIAWDVWNDNQWRTHAPDMVCYCKHSLANFRAFLMGKYNTLDRLGDAWGRRIVDWHDVRPGRLAGNCYPEMHDYTAWLEWRAQDTATWRYEALDEWDGSHPIGSHTGNPTIFDGTNDNENIFSRGIDSDVAQGAHYGLSVFPRGGDVARDMDGVAIAARMNSVTSANGEKPTWMSELQGGPAAQSGMYGPAISGAEQQSWLWTGIARGCKGAMLWCWRPEVFGQEANGYGFIADDGFANDRREAMRKTAEVIAALGDNFNGYQPDKSRVGVVFQRDGYFYDWMRAQGDDAQTYNAPQRLLAWVYAMERLNVPYTILDDRHLPADLSPCRLLITPDPTGLDDRAAARLAVHAEHGGVLFAEGGAGLLGPDTFMRYPNERPLYRSLGIREGMFRAATQPTRTLPAGAMGNDQPIDIAVEQYEQTFDADQDGAVTFTPDGLTMLVNKSYGQGRIITLGATVGVNSTATTMNQLAVALLRTANIEPTVAISTDGGGFCSARVGSAGDQRLLIVTNHGTAQHVTLSLSENVGNAKDLMGREVNRADAHTLTLAMRKYDVAVIVW